MCSVKRFLFSHTDVAIQILQNDMNKVVSITHGPCYAVERYIWI